VLAHELKLNVPRSVQNSITSTMYFLSHHDLRRAEAQVLEAGAAAVEADWPLELARLSFPAAPLGTQRGPPGRGAPGEERGGMSLSSAPATPDDLDWLLETSGATALMLLEVRGRGFCS